MGIVADLHMHLTCSDEKYLPIAILEKVISVGLSTFALPGHDTIGHLPIINEYIKSERIKAHCIPTTELSCEHNGDSIHIFAYFQNDDSNTSLIYSKNGLKIK